MSKRSPRPDNLRALLMLLVVFAHCLELFWEGSLLYRAIYAFHMPAFVFLTGFFARPSTRRIGTTLGIYIAFQTLYLLFDAHILGTGAALQYTTPYWLLWYALSMHHWLLLLIPFSRQTKRRQLVLLALSVILALLCGYDASVGYTLSLSRTIVFLPFFLLGHLFSGEARLHAAVCEGPPRLIRLAGSAVMIAVCCAMVLYLRRYPGLSAPQMYGSYSYAAYGYGAVTRAKLFVIALCFLVLLLLAVPGVRIPLFTRAGENTLPVFLLHGFLLRLMRQYGVFRFSLPVNLALAAVLSLLILLLLSALRLPRPMQRKDVPAA